MKTKKAALSLLGLTALTSIYLVGQGSVYRDLGGPEKYQQIENLRKATTKDPFYTWEAINSLEKELWDIRKEAYLSWLHYLK